MSKIVSVLFIVFRMHAATAEAIGEWTRLDDKLNCGEHSCVVIEGAKKFEIRMTTSEKRDLVYLDRLSIKNLATGRMQDFEVSAVNAAEHNEPFEMYRVNLRSRDKTDLALKAFNSAKAGPSYYYFLYDERADSFVMTEDTVPKLKVDPKTRALASEVQDVPFRVESMRLKER